MEFRSIDGYEGIYEVCSDGTILTCNGKIKKRVWKRRQIKPQIQKRVRSKHSDKRVKLWKDKRMKTHLVSRLVATTFIPNPENKGFVNHKNGNPLDNSVKNLEWTTRSENQLHALKTGLMSASKKVKLKSLANGNEYQFCSLAEASRFLGKNHGFLSRKLKDGKNISGYEITLV